jgi:hypothetical protein
MEVDYCHTLVMHTTLAITELPEKFNGDYYLAIVTILPILLLATDVLVNFAKSIPSDVQRNWPHPFYALVSFFYLFSPAIAAIGVAVGVIALMQQSTSAVYRWITFTCLIAVLVFLTIASIIYLGDSDPAKDAQSILKRRKKSDRRKEVRARPTSEPVATLTDAEKVKGSSETAPPQTS